MTKQRTGFMLVLSSPSGAGKTTLSRLLLEKDPYLTMSVSATTRPRRPNEVDGRDYYFVDEERFHHMVERHEMLEHACVFGHWYGTPAEHVERTLEGGKDVLFDIDWQGTEQLNRHCREDVVSVFILPPSMQELEQRLRGRAQDSDEVIAGRMAKASSEISHWESYDYVLVNHDVEKSLKSLLSIVTAERMRRTRQPQMQTFVADLLGSVS